ncbi:hypothetical protein MXM41_05290 [Leclercia adecarboxylata]|uniref:hypothetical protein n=1 Tax=Leclercia adecarboxylata TaxID=83655 RepID=UPI002DB9EFE1|nr:hypothetical protein [Leclercia adecarboxylata]MEB6378347.1 hypothetical protein [Leclercia adecarboxylata]
MKVYIIVALYYPHYFEKVKKEIFAIFNKMDFHVLFVDNSGKLIPQNESEGNIHWLRGSNVAGEFSAWDEGYAFLAENNTPGSDDIVVFMNDTFCHHRFFTFYDRILYRRATAHCACNSFYGELNRTGAVFTVNELPLTAWISSYVFLSRMENIDKLLPLNYTSTISNEHLAQIEHGLAQRKVDVPFFSENLNQHLSHWLFPVSGNGWYKAGKISPAILLFKLKAIINEKLLTHKALKNDLSVEGIYKGKPGRIYNSLRNRLYIFCKRHK